jgi:hypothetical protein
LLERFVAVIAEPLVVDPVSDLTDDRLARRNALVLAVAQALAGQQLARRRPAA